LKFYGRRSVEAWLDLGFWKAAMPLWRVTGDGWRDDADEDVGVPIGVHGLGGLGFFCFGSFFNSEAAFSKSKSTRRGKKGQSRVLSHFGSFSLD
jgi:hypothetical protein